MSNQRVLVTGGQGFIGRYLIKRVLDSDPEAEVLSVGRSPERPDTFTHWISWKGARMRAPLQPSLSRSLTSRRHRYHRVDLLDSFAVKNVVETFRPTVVFHLAGELRGENTARLLKNVESTENLVDHVATTSVDPPRIVLGSTGAVYGPRSPSGRPVSERCQPNPVDVYAASKLGAEHIARIQARRHGLTVICARIFNVLGPGQDERHIVGSLASQFVAIERKLQLPTVTVGPLVTTRDFLDVRDVARALYLLSQRGSDGVYNVASGSETHIEALYEAMRVLTTYSGPIARQTLPSRSDDNARVVVDIGRVEALGFRPEISRVTSLADVLEYYRSTVPQDHGGATRRPGSSARETTHKHAHSLRVSGHSEFGYDVNISEGLLADLPAYLARTYRGSLIGILTDTTVDAVYGCDFIERLRSQGQKVVGFRIGDGEAAKSFESYRSLLRQMYESGLRRRNVLVCLGGGVVSDVGGFAAASYMRGIPYINVPTTLLAQADAAVGGKVAVNTTWAKNFVGAFHHPEAVFVDPWVLRSLDRRQMASGVSEAIKVAIVGDPQLFDLLGENAEAILDQREPTVLAEIIRRALAVKIDCLAPDPFERDLRRVLNFGHCVGHAIETAIGYEGVLHGEAVAFGIAVATACAVDLGVISESEAERITTLIGRFEAAAAVPSVVSGAVIDHLEAIRMVRGGKLHFVLPEEVGRVRIIDDIPRDLLDGGIAKAMYAFH